MVLMTEYKVTVARNGHTITFEHDATANPSPLNLPCGERPKEWVMFAPDRDVLTVRRMDIVAIQETRGITTWLKPKIKK
jgi:hypothetical protein